MKFSNDFKVSFSQTKNVQNSDIFLFYELFESNEIMNMSKVTSKDVSSVLNLHVKNFFVRNLIIKIDEREVLLPTNQK